MSRVAPAERCARGRLGLGLLGVLVTLLAAACSRQAPESSPQLLRISQRNEPASLDPHLATLPDEFFVIRALGEGLLAPVPDGGPPQPAAAASWRMSPDGLTYTFALRPEAKWSNGDPVTAADFVFSIRRALTPTLAAPSAPLFFGLKNAEDFYRGTSGDFSAVGARALAEHTLELTLREPIADFPAIVASGAWIPVHRASVEKSGPADRRENTWTTPPHYVGNGPFILAAWRPNRDLSLKRNPHYHAADRIKLHQLRLLAYDSGDSEERAFRTGQLDVTMAVPASKIASYRSQQPPVLHRAELHEVRYLALNTRRPPLDDPRVRRALALSLHRQSLTENVLKGGQQPAFNFVHAGLGGYEPGARLTENISLARRLLAEAGFPDGRNFPRLELATWGVAPAQLEAIQQMWWRELKITVSLAQREASTHIAALAAGDYALAFMTAIPDYDGASSVFSTLTSGHPGNYPRWSNREFDRLVRAAGRESSLAERNFTYQAAEAVLLEEMPVIPLYFNTQNFLVHPSVQNWRADRMWTRFYADVFIR